jgi:hypothetical protein
MLWNIFWIGVRVTVIKLILDNFLILELNLIVIWITVQKMSVSGIVVKAPSRGDNTSTRKTFSGRVIHKNFHAEKFISFLNSKKLLLINSTKVTSMSNFVDI